MKKISVFLIATIFAVGSVLASGTEPVKVNTHAISVEMGKLLKAPRFIVEEDIKTLVTFTINDDNEVIVLSVDSEDSRVVGYIKAQLNYKKLSTQVRGDGELPQYKLPVHFKKSK